MRNQILLLLFLSITVLAGEPAARFELASVPQVSQAAARMDNAIAPRFRDTVAAVTVVLTMGATRYGMNLTRPSEIHFYSFGEKPAMRIIAYALPEVREPETRGRMWGLRFRARRKGDLIAFDTEDLTEPFPAEPPGKNLKPGELLRGTVRADAVHRHFRFGSFNTKEMSSRLILNGLDELLAQLRDAAVVFTADAEALKLDLTVRATEKSALAQWMKQPLPAKGPVQSCSGTEMISVLRLNPTAGLKKYGQEYLEGKRKNILPRSLPDAVTGFAVMSIRNSGTNPSSRLAVGIDPARSAAIKKEIGKFGYTPFTGWYQLRKEPPMFCSGTGDQVIFCGMVSLDKSTLDDLFRPKDHSGIIPDRPFICLDLKQPDRPLAELRLEGDAMRLILQAPDSWFAECRPLLEKPLLFQAEKRRP